MDTVQLNNYKAQNNIGPTTFNITYNFKNRVMKQTFIQENKY